MYASWQEPLARAVTSDQAAPALSKRSTTQHVLSHMPCHLMALVVSLASTEEDSGVCIEHDEFL